MARTRALRTVLASLVVVAVGACGEGSSTSGSPYALQARIGTYDDGSGRIGLAVLATLRDRAGAGPAAPWPAWVMDAGGTLATAEYARAGAGSYAAWWWPEVTLQDGAENALAVDDGTLTLEAPLAGAAASGLALPAPTLAADASRIDWPAVPGAAAYVCRIFEAGALRLEATGALPGCDLSALPPGGYEASVVASTADLSAIAADASQTPWLPARFDVSEARLALVRPDGSAPALQLLAAGGAFDFGTWERGLAVWVSLRQADGSATDQPWNVSIVGPGIPAEAPVTFAYHAYLPRQMAWSYDVPATPGTYAMTATSGASAVSATFTVGHPPSLPFVIDPQATAGAEGSAQVTWSTVEGARAYLVEAVDHLDARQVNSVWTPAPPVAFPKDTFTVGRTYDVFVAATDADMSGATTPTQVSVSEYGYPFASFVE